MLGGEDWLQDPLMGISKGSYKPRKLKSPADKQNDLWHIFHVATRLKLNGAAYFCRQVVGVASMPDDVGLPLLAYSQLKWYLDAFFFELMSAYETLLQELNIVYAYDLGLQPKQVRWDTREGRLKGKLGDRLPERLAKCMKEQRGEDWFKNVCEYRNMAAHYHYIPTDSVTMRRGKGLCGYGESLTYIYYFDDVGVQRRENIGYCKTHLESMAKHIQQVWKEMAQEFQQGVLEGC